MILDLKPFLPSKWYTIKTFFMKNTYFKKSGKSTLFLSSYDNYIYLNQKYFI